MPVHVKLRNPRDATDLLSAKPLGDPAVGPGLIEPDVAADQSFGGGAVTVSLGGTLSVRAFNSSDDEDEDGVLGEPAADAALAGLKPQLRLTAKDAFLKYRCRAGVKATAAGTPLSSLGFAFEGAAELVLADYQRHPRTSETRAAVLEGLTALRSSLSLTDVLEKLQPNEAVSQQVFGRLSTTVEVSWSDVFTGSVGPLMQLAGTAVPLMVKVSAGATLKARVSLTDDFLLVFSRDGADTWRVGLRKARTREAAIGVDLGIQVEPDEAQVAAVLGAVVEGLIGERLARVESLLAAATLEDLPESQQKLARALLNRLGLNGTPTIDGLRSRVGLIREGIEAAVTEIAKSKLQIGFAYEYRRVGQDTTIAQCVLTRAGLKRHHAELVRGRIEPTLVDAAGGVDGASLEHYLHEKTIRSERSWGFSLSIGKWHAGSRDAKAITRVERKSALGRPQQSFLGVRTYSESGEPKPKWSVDFAADMPGYSSTATGPLMSEFQYGLALAWFEDAKKLNATTLEEWLDLAVLWGACSENDLPGHREVLAEALKKKCSMVAQIACPHEAFSIMRTRMAAAEPRDIGAALGAAMPWMDLAGRQSVALRRRLYGPLWDMYLSTTDHMHNDGRAFSQAARTHLAAQGFEQLGGLERLYQITPLRQGDPTTFAGSIDLQRSTIQNCHDFFNGVKTLQTGVLSAAPAAHAMGHVFAQMEHLFGQHLHVRALGAYLLDVARITGAAKHAGRSFSLTVAGEKSAPGQVFVIAG